MNDIEAQCPKLMAKQLSNRDQRLCDFKLFFNFNCRMSVRRGSKISI
jgi:hypothetical protein